MIFSRDSGQHKPDETTNQIRTHHHANQATQFLLDINESLEKHSIPSNSFKTNNSSSFYSIQKRNSTRYKSTLRRAMQLSTYHPAYAIFNRQLSRTSALANLTRPGLPSDLTFDDRNPRA
jgi:hypothetical protein